MPKLRTLFPITGKSIQAPFTASSGRRAASLRSLTSAESSLPTEELRGTKPPTSFLYRSAKVKILLPDATATY